MTAAAPWSVKGIDPKTREIAKDLARRSGMTLGEWLTHVIADDSVDALAAGAARRIAERPASENRAPRRGGEDLDRLFEAVEGLSARFEAQVQEQAETAARFEQVIADLKADQTKVAARLQAAEQAGGAAGGGKIETLRALEGALNKVAGHLAEGEGRHRAAMAEMRRELGEELSRVADQMNLRILESENRSADAIFQVGSEITRVANSVEQRLRRADDAQAEALEKLGGEIARITERLSDRIGASERRAAQSVEDVGEQVARMADRIHARQERSESELAERIRQSEERTATMLEEARRTIDRLLRVGASGAEEDRASDGPSNHWTPPAEADAFGSTSTSAFEAADDAAESSSLLEQAPSGGREEALFAVEAEADEPVLEVEAEVLEAARVEQEPVAESFYDGLAIYAETPLAVDEPYGDHDEDDGEAIADSAEAGAEAEDHTEAMQAVADAIASDPLEAPEGELEISDDLEPEESLRPSTRDLIAEAKAAAFSEPASYAREATEAEEDDGVTFAGFASRRPRQSHAMRGALLAGGAAAFMGLAGAGYVAMHPEMMHGPSAPAANPIPVGPPSSPTPAPAPAAQQAAVALATAPTPRPVGPDLEGLYREAAAKVDNGDASGVASLRTAANLGYAPAQRRLGKLYEDGGAGMDKDPVEGRRWTLRAAANGDVRAMHNLALDYYQGIGGPKNPVIAAQYFQRAAELGLRDSQYNLARFMETGIGVQQDLAGAYRWYLIAARAGDSEAEARASALKPRLTADQRSRAQALAGAFQPDPAAGPASLATLLRGSNPKQLALAQRALAKLGYYKGPDDGAASEALGEAIQTYQRERGLAANGQLSPELLQTFAHIVQ